MAHLLFPGYPIRLSPLSFATLTFDSRLPVLSRECLMTGLVQDFRVISYPSIRSSTTFCARPNSGLGGLALFEVPLTTLWRSLMRLLPKRLLLARRTRMYALLHPTLCFTASTILASAFPAPIPFSCLKWRTFNPKTY